MSSALVSASLGSDRIMIDKCVAVRSGGHHDELRSGEKWMNDGLSVVRRRQIYAGEVSAKWRDQKMSDFCSPEAGTSLVTPVPDCYTFAR